MDVDANIQRELNGSIGSLQEFQNQNLAEIQLNFAQFRQSVIYPSDNEIDTMLYRHFVRLFWMSIESEASALKLFLRLAKSIINGVEQRKSAMTSLTEKTECVRNYKRAISTLISDVENIAEYIEILLRFSNSDENGEIDLDLVGREKMRGKIPLFEELHFMDRNHMVHRSSKMHEFVTKPPIFQGDNVFPLLNLRIVSNRLEAIKHESIFVVGNRLGIDGKVGRSSDGGQLTLIINCSTAFQLKDLVGDSTAALSLVVNRDHESCHFFYLFYRQQEITEADRGMRWITVNLGKVDDKFWNSVWPYEFGWRYENEFIGGCVLFGMALMKDDDERADIEQQCRTMLLDYANISPNQAAVVDFFQTRGMLVFQGD